VHSLNLEWGVKFITTGDPSDRIATTGKYAGPSWCGCMTDHYVDKVGFTTNVLLNIVAEYSIRSSIMVMHFSTHQVVVINGIILQI
jgi:hypothetical protein